MYKNIANVKLVYWICKALILDRHGDGEVSDPSKTHKEFGDLADFVTTFLSYSRFLLSSHFRNSITRPCVKLIVHFFSKIKHSFPS